MQGHSHTRVNKTPHSNTHTEGHNLTTTSRPEHAVGDRDGELSQGLAKASRRLVADKGGRDGGDPGRGGGEVWLDGARLGAVAVVAGASITRGDKDTDTTGAKLQELHVATRDVRGAKDGAVLALTKAVCRGVGGQGTSITSYGEWQSPHTGLSPPFGYYYANVQEMEVMRGGLVELVISMAQPMMKEALGAVLGLEAYQKSVVTPGDVAMIHSMSSVDSPPGS